MAERPTDPCHLYVMYGLANSVFPLELRMAAAIYVAIACTFKKREPRLGLIHAHHAKV